MALFNLFDAIVSLHELEWLVADPEFDMASFWGKLEGVLNQVEEDFRVEDPIGASVIWNFVDYLEFKCDLSLKSLNMIRLQKLINKRKHRVF